MKTIIKYLTVSLIALIVLAAKYPQLEIGDRAPLIDVTMKGVDCDMVSISNVKRDNGVIVIFSCNTCPFVKAWEGRYNDIKKWAGDNNTGLLVVNSNWAKRNGADSFEKMQAHAEKEGYNFPYVQDTESKLANAFGAQTTPHVFLFDGDFRLVYKGAIDDNYKNADKVGNHWLKDAIIALGKGEEIKVQSSPPKGCSIKREIP